MDRYVVDAREILIKEHLADSLPVSQKVVVKEVPWLQSKLQYRLSLYQPPSFLPLFFLGSLLLAATGLHKVTQLLEAQDRSTCSCLSLQTIASGHMDDCKPAI